MKILQIFLACLIFLIGQIALSYAVDVKGAADWFPSRRFRNP